MLQNYSLHGTIKIKISYLYGATLLGERLALLEDSSVFFWQDSVSYVRFTSCPIRQLVSVPRQAQRVTGHKFCSATIVLARPNHERSWSSVLLLLSLLSDAIFP
jgi:hypothetical protein